MNPSIKFSATYPVYVARAPQIAEYEGLLQEKQIPFRIFKHEQSNTDNTPLLVVTGEQDVAEFDGIWARNQEYAKSVTPEEDAQNRQQWKLQRLLEVIQQSGLKEKLAVLTRFAENTGEQVTRALTNQFSQDSYSVKNALEAVSNELIYFNSRHYENETAMRSKEFSDYLSARNDENGWGSESLSAMIPMAKEGKLNLETGESI